MLSPYLSAVLLGVISILNSVASNPVERRELPGSGFDSYRNKKELPNLARSQFQLDTFDDVSDLRTNGRPVTEDDVISAINDLSPEERNQLSQMLELPKSQNLRIVKRRCKFNLGGHCSTERVMEMMKMYHMLQQPWSPGRRK